MTVLKCTSSGLAAGGSQFIAGRDSVRAGSAGSEIWHLDRPGILGGAAASDVFGTSLTAWNFGVSSQADLAIGAPGRDYFPSPFLRPELNRTNVGNVSVLYGSSSGVDATGNQLWHQDSPGIADPERERRSIRDRAVLTPAAARRGRRPAVLRVSGANSPLCARSPWRFATGR